MLAEELRRFFDSHHIPPCRLLAACSGGPDSTALLLALSSLRGEGYEVVCGHVNHRLRGPESDADQAFVESLCNRLGVQFLVRNAPLTPEAVRRSGVEAAAREGRTTALRQMASENAASYIATAHQRDDQAETVIMRLVTGTGLGGLRAIHPVREDGFIRPLLAVSRAEIERFLEAEGIAARHDSTNADPRFLRNRIRAALKQLDDSHVQNIAAVADQARALWPSLERMIDLAESECVRVQPELTRFRGWPDDLWLRSALLHRHIRRLDPRAREVSNQDLSRLAASMDQIRRVSVTNRLELVRRGQELLLTVRAESIPEFEFALTPGQPLFIPPLQATIEIRPSDPQSAAQKFQLPAPDGRFSVRNRRRGDRFHPLGMPRAMKLKDFLIGRKIPAQDRDRIPLLLWNDEIVWVGGVEISERFKVTSPTGDVHEILFGHAHPG